MRRGWRVGCEMESLRSTGSSYRSLRIIALHLILQVLSIDAVHQTESSARCSEEASAVRPGSEVAPEPPGGRRKRAATKKTAEKKANQKSLALKFPDGPVIKILSLP